MKQILAAFALLLAIGFNAEAGQAQVITKFPGTVAAFKNVQAGDTLKGRVVKAKSVGDTVAAAKLITGPRAVIDTLNGYPTLTYAVLDSAKTGLDQVSSDSLFLSCGAWVCGVFKNGLTDTTSGTAMTVGTLPAACRPARTTRVPILFMDADTLRTGSVSWATTGIGTLSRANATGSITATLLAAGTLRGIPAGAGFCFTRK